MINVQKYQICCCVHTHKLLFIVKPEHHSPETETLPYTVTQLLQDRHITANENITITQSVGPILLLRNTLKTSCTHWCTLTQTDRNFCQFVCFYEFVNHFQTFTNTVTGQLLIFPSQQEVAHLFGFL